ncbi:hypothetical protein BJ742DRAFT_90843 [Cladochytrium replicatum]|nr:hypothetical protein BJ742DRAFT_90843 [Cladochytrium replicatum]
MADRDLRSSERDRGRSLPTSGKGANQRVSVSPPRASRPDPDDPRKDRSISRSRSRSGERKHKSKKSKSKKSKHHRDDEKKKRRRRSRSSSGSRSRSPPDDDDSDHDRHRKKRSSRKRRRDLSSGSSRSRGSTDRSRSPSRSPPRKSKDRDEKKEKGGERDYGRPVERGGAKKVHNSGSEDEYLGGGDRRRRDDNGDDRRGGDRRSGGNPYDDRAPRRPKLPVTRGTDEERRTTTHVFVGNIPYDYNDRDVGDLCEKYGNVTSVTVPMDRATGKNRGFSFVKFEDRIAAEDFVKAMEDYSLEGRKLRVDWDVGKQKKGGPGDGRGG